MTDRKNDKTKPELKNGDKISGMRPCNPKSNDVFWVEPGAPIKIIRSDFEESTRRQSTFKTIRTFVEDSLIFRPLKHEDLSMDNDPAHVWARRGYYAFKCGESEQWLYLIHETKVVIR